MYICIYRSNRDQIGNHSARGDGGGDGDAATRVDETQDERSTVTG